VARPMAEVVNTPLRVMILLVRRKKPLSRKITSMEAIMYLVISLWSRIAFIPLASGSSRKIHPEKPYQIAPSPSMLQIAQNRIPVKVKVSQIFLSGSFFFLVPNIASGQKAKKRKLMLMKSDLCEEFIVMSQGVSKKPRIPEVLPRV